MASPIAKKVKIRMSRCIEQLLQLRPHCDGDDDTKRLEQAIAIARDASARIEDVLHASDQVPKPAAVKKNDVVEIRYPSSQPAAAPAPGRREAQPKPYTGAVATMMERDDDGFGQSPLNMTDAEWVEAAIAGKVGGVSTGEAALKLSADTAAWALMDDEERAKAIRALADKLDDEYDAAAASKANGGDF